MLIISLTMENSLFTMILIAFVLTSYPLVPAELNGRSTPELYTFTYQPAWTGSGKAAFGSCHEDGTNPADMSGRHEKHVKKKNIKCYQYHYTTVVDIDNIIGKSFHVDGQIKVSFSSGQGTFINGECRNVGCHGTERW